MQKPIDDEIVIVGGVVANGAEPGRLAFVHRQEVVGVETLQMSALGTTARCFQTSLTEGTLQRYVQGRSGNVCIIQ